MDKKKIIQPVIFAIIVYIIWELTGNAAARLISLVLKRWQIVLPGEYWYMLLSEMSSWLLFIIVFYKYIKNNKIFYSSWNIKHIWFFMPVVLQVLNDICTLIKGDKVIKLLSPEGIAFVVPCFLGTMSIGLLEETVWRRVIFVNALGKWKDTKKGVVYAVLFQALLFGLCHYINMLTAGQDFSGTSKQVFSSVCMGVFLAGIYYNTGKFAVPVFIHGLCNFSNFFMNEMLGWDYNTLKWSGILQAVTSLLYLAFGIMAAGNGRQESSTETASYGGYNGKCNTGN